MNDGKELSDVTLVSEDDEGIKAHKLKNKMKLPAASPTSREVE